MTKYRSAVAAFPWAETPTYKTLHKHYEKYGLDNHGTGYRGADQRYTSYAKFSADALIEVAFDYLGENAYVQFCEAVGYGNFTEQARADWRAERGLDTPTATSKAPQSRSKARNSTAGSPARGK